MTREEAIAILIREIDEDPFMRTEHRELIHGALNMAIKALEQEPKTGRWIKHDTGHSIYYDCSRCTCIAPCTETADKWLWRLSNYCPDCGAKMIESQESEDK